MLLDNNLNPVCILKKHQNSKFKIFKKKTPEKIKEK